MPNHLANEASPYLRQHADNPVDWYPWGEEALRLAREQDKPILLSIGYASCHWCHVMAHESFENEAIASLMNEHFINIKVDREERPDLDSIYMTAAQVMTGHGGWPLTIFLTPDGLPFYAGTYFPPEDRQVGSSVMPGLPRVLLAVAEAYRTRRNEVEQGGEQIREILERHYARSMPDSALTPTVLDDAVRRLVEQFDRVNGGFGGAPKFPSPMPLELLLRTYRRIDSQRALDMVRMTLVHMAFGGIYDQVGGGFHRYTVDAGWLVPHFEKMLYDNAQLARLYTLAWQVTGSSLYERIALETFAYVLREMTSPEGGFYASQDADSEGEEGKFYLWTPEEIRAALPPREAAMVERFFGVEPGGNFEGKTILSVPRDPAIVAEELGVPLEELVTTVAQARDALYAARARRVWPGRDEKVLTAWNGLMLRALAEGAAAFDRADLRDAAIRNARFIREALYVDGHLMRSWTAGRARVPGFLEDYADVIDGLIALYELTFDVQWIRWARELAGTMIAEFWDDERGGFFDTPVSPEQLITRPKELAETATPSGNSVAADAFLRLAALTGDEDLRRRAVAIVAANGPVAAEQPIAYGRLLAAYDLALAPQSEIALVGDPDSPDTAALLRAVRSAYLPWKVVALKRPGDETSEADVPLLAGRVTQDGRATAYVCRHFTCRLPVIEPADLMRELELVAADAAS